ncbi:MAG: hypothetical protein J0L75_14085 [Spirochaetes bacterium]|nr:hypothetical protein [Spirochaetota bacterium]
METLPPLGLEEAVREIDATEWGEYGSDHDWSPSYSPDDKAAVLGKLLARWDGASVEARGAVLLFLRKLLADPMGFAGTLPGVCLEYASIEELAPPLAAACRSGIFSLHLLFAMKRTGRRPPEWLALIGALCEGAQFTESKKILKRGDLYGRARGLLKELGSDNPASP